MLAGASSGIILQVVSRADLEAPSNGNLNLRDVETGSSLELRMTQDVALRYKESMRRHVELWREAARAVAAAHFLIIAEDFVKHWDVSELVEGGVLQAVP